MEVCPLGGWMDKRFRITSIQLDKRVLGASIRRKEVLPPSERGGTDEEGSS